MLVLALAAALTTTAALERSARADKDEWGNEKEDDDEKKPHETNKETKPAKPVEPPDDGAWDIYDVTEKPGKAYFFVGLQYRGNVVPAFMLHLFIDEGRTVYTNMIGAEFEYRKDGFSLIPGISYHELGFDDLIFKEKNSIEISGNYGVVNSGLKVLYGKLDILWSTKLQKNLEFEYGFGVGIGAVFGDLANSWVRYDDKGPLSNDAGRRFSRCAAVDAPGTGCNKADHQNSSINKVGGYTEPSWFNGGSKPNFWPWISVPQFGLRFKPMKNIVGRVGIGFSLSGFWFGVQAEYGLEQKPKP